MKRSTKVAACAALLACASVSTAGAAAVPEFTATQSADGTMAFDGSASVCEFGPCGYNWRWDDGTRLGVNMGSGPVVAFQFPAAGWQTVTLKVSQHCFEGSARWCWRTLSEQVFVADADTAATA
jgi:type 1 fimbria pilin